MTLPAGFDKALAAMTDREVFDMVAHGEDYMPEALAAARSELARRELGPEAVAALREVAIAEAVESDRRAELPLGWPLKILSFLVPGGLILILMIVYGNRGFLRRQHECRAWAGRGILLYFLFAWSIVGLSSLEKRDIHISGWLYGLAALVSLGLAIGIPALPERWKPRLHLPHHR